MRAERKRVDATLRLPFRQAALEIGDNARGGLVAVLGCLREQLHDDRRDLRRNGWHPFAGRHRLARDVAVHPGHRIGGGEGECAREHLVEPGIDRAVHPSRLFRRHVGQRSGDHLGRLGDLMLARQPRGDAEACEPGGTARHIYQDIRRLDVLVDQVSLMDVPERGRERDGDAQELRRFQRMTEQSIERLATGILEHQRRPVVAMCERERPCRPAPVELRPERVFMFEPLESLGRGMFRNGRDKQNGSQAVAGAPAHRELPLTQRRELVTGKRCHEGLPSTTSSRAPPTIPSAVAPEAQAIIR